MNKLIILDWVGTLFERHKEVFDFSEEILKYLRPNYKLVLVSVSQKDIDGRKKEIKDSGLDKYFDEVIVGKDKTPELFSEIIRKYNSNPENTFVIGDRVIREIFAGNKIGAKTFWINTSHRSDEMPTKETGNPDYIISSVKDLLKYL
jgi:FMN phosphatase YigB (HAD superfamily)